MPDPSTILQLGFLKVSALTVGITGSVAVHAVGLIALHAVMSENPSTLSSETESAFPEGQSIKVRITAKEHRPIEWSHSTSEPVRQPPTEEARDHIDIQVMRSSQQDASLQSALWATESTAPVMIDRFMMPNAAMIALAAPLVERREAEPAPAPTPIERVMPMMPICTAMDVLDPSLPLLPEQPIGVEQGARSMRLDEPIYPPRSIRLGQEGTVVVEVEILESGLIGTVRIHTSSGYRLLDQAALKAAKKGRYDPALRNGIAARSLILVPFEFHLK